MVILRENSTGEIGLGLDIKWDGGAIVVAPSLHAGGKRYRWRNAAQIANAPGWFGCYGKRKDRARTGALR